MRIHITSKNPTVIICLHNTSADMITIHVGKSVNKFENIFRVFSITSAVGNRELKRYIFIYTKWQLLISDYSIGLDLLNCYVWDIC